MLARNFLFAILVAGAALFSSLSCGGAQGGGSSPPNEPPPGMTFVEVSFYKKDTTKVLSTIVTTVDKTGDLQVVASTAAAELKKNLKAQLATHAMDLGGSGKISQLQLVGVQSRQIAPDILIQDWAIIDDANFESRVSSVFIAIIENLGDDHKEILKPMKRVLIQVFLD